MMKNQVTEKNLRNQEVSKAGERFTKLFIEKYSERLHKASLEIAEKTLQECFEEISNLEFKSENLLGDSKEQSNKEVDVETFITNYLNEIGIPRHIKGFNYIRSAITLVLEDTDIINSVTKRLYPEVAKMYQTTSSRVERAIRHAIEVGFTRGNQGVLERIFGYTMSMYKGKPTNSEFIALLADRIRLELK